MRLLSNGLKSWRRRRMWQGNIIASQCNWIRNSPALQTREMGHNIRHANMYRPAIEHFFICESHQLIYIFKGLYIDDISRKNDLESHCHYVTAGAISAKVNNIASSAQIYTELYSIGRSLNVAIEKKEIGDDAI